MERRTKQRIIGVLVLIGFTIIMLPFFQSNKDIPGATTVLVQAPPFPDQAIQETPSSTSVSQENINPQVDDMLGVVPAIKKDTQPFAGSEQTSSSIKDKITETNAGSHISHKKLIYKKITTKNKALVTKQGKRNQLAVNDKNVLAKLPQAAWVIQIGSFKSKANALQFVDQLRAHGYKAFIQQVSTSLGDSTRVFVGPEEQHGAARALASKLKEELKINGIIISYKPLSL